MLMLLPSFLHQLPTVHCIWALLPFLVIPSLNMASFSLKKILSEISAVFL